MKTRLIKFILIMLGYAVILYLCVAWIAWEIDWRWWWDWQRAIFITAILFSSECVWHRTKEI